MTRPRPLEGLRILDLSRLLPGPLATLHLADLGADVIKIEDTQAGDYVRWMLPKAKVNSQYFLLLNRNKRAVTLDLKDPDGREAFLALVKDAHGVLESFRPGVMARLGLDYETLRAVNPGLVMVALSGYGQDGPLAEKAGHDINYLALSGVLHQIAARDGTPAQSNWQIADIAGGALTAVTGMLAGLLEAQRTGQGRFIDVSMTDSVMRQAVPIFAETLGRGQPPTPGQARLSGALPCYNVYRCADGGLMAVGALEPKFWQAFCAAVAQPDWTPRGEDPSLIADVEALFATKDRAHWEAVFAPTDCCVTPVLDMREALASAHAKARGATVTATHPVEGELTGFAPVLDVSDMETAPYRPAPMYGEHTQELLSAAGVSPDVIAKMLPKRA